MEKIVYQAVDRGNAYYTERTDRNIGWLLPDEQEVLRRSVVGVAGNGGMGGLLSAVLVRTGMGEVRITDKEVFDLSNMNRQFAARRRTVGKSKALETAKELRRITDDVRIVVYPEGIVEETAEDFVNGCDLVLDEIEFFAVSARILLHQKARACGVPVINCNVVGFGTRLFLFTPESMTMEELLGLSYEEAQSLEADTKLGDMQARSILAERVLDGLIPDIPEYRKGERERLMRRLLEEGKASILATNPPLSTGFVADRVLLYLLERAGWVRNIVSMPAMPGYLFFDAARMDARVVTGRWTTR